MFTQTYLFNINWVLQKKEPHSSHETVRLFSHYIMKKRFLELKRCLLYIDTEIFDSSGNIFFHAWQVLESGNGLFAT